MRAQPIHVGAGVCGMLRPGAVLVRCRDTDPRGAPLRRGQDLAGRQVHDPVRSPQGARVSVQARSGALRVTPDFPSARTRCQAAPPSRSTGLIPAFKALR